MSESFVSVLIFPTFPIIILTIIFLVFVRQSLVSLMLVAIESHNIDTVRILLNFTNWTKHLDSSWLCFHPILETTYTNGELWPGMPLLYTSLYIAVSCSGDRLEIIQLLLDNGFGCTVNARNYTIRMLWTTTEYMERATGYPLYLALSKNYWRVADLLLQSGSGQLDQYSMYLVRGGNMSAQMLTVLSRYLVYVESAYYAEWIRLANCRITQLN